MAHNARAKTARQTRAFVAIHSTEHESPVNPAAAVLVNPAANPLLVEYEYEYEYRYSYSYSYDMFVVTVVSRHSSWLFYLIAAEGRDKLFSAILN